MDEGIINELTELAEDFAHGKKILNINKIYNNLTLSADVFDYSFTNALKEFRGLKPDDYYYKSRCDTFHDVVMVAKAHDVIIDKQSEKELDECKKHCSELEIELEDSKSTIEKLRDIRSKLEERIRIHESMYKDLKQLGNTEESEVAENE